MTSDETFREAARRLKESAPGATIILFSSHPQGDARQGSELDFMVVEPEVKARWEEMERLRLAVGRIGIPVDILVRPKQGWRRTLKRPSWPSMTPIPAINGRPAL